MQGYEYQSAADRTIPKMLSIKETELHALHGMVSEIGEIHSIYQKSYQGHKLDEDRIKSELGDLLWFVAEYCIAMGWSIDDVMQGNIDKLMNRYPDGFSAERSLHRKEGDL